MFIEETVKLSDHRCSYELDDGEVSLFHDRPEVTLTD